jgi:hypothetical protein
MCREFMIESKNNFKVLKSKASSDIRACFSFVEKSDFIRIKFLEICNIFEDFKCPGSIGWICLNNFLIIREFKEKFIKSFIGEFSEIVIKKTFKYTFNISKFSKEFNHRKSWCNNLFCFNNFLCSRVFFFNLFSIIFHKMII